jgi:sugar O-acyltransferase (sialic acid O-acetyltransferase NeuD family)
MAAKKLVIFGLGDIARLAFHYFKNDGGYEISAFTLDSAYLGVDTLLGLPAVPAEELRDIYPPEEFVLFVGLSYGAMNRNRAVVYERMQEWGYHFASFVDPKASVLSQNIGQNVLVMGNVTVEPSAEIGNNVIIGPNAVISHGCRIKDHNYIAPCACLCGDNVVSEYCIIGASATIAPRVHIGHGNFIGIGARIFHHTGDNEAYLTGATGKSSRSASFHERLSRTRGERM